MVIGGCGVSALPSRPIQIINARDLHCGLGVGRDFATWIKGRIERGQFVEDRDYVVEILDRQNGRTSEPPVERNGFAVGGGGIA
jgi:phage anti-repressor protein